MGGNAAEGAQAGAGIARVSFIFDIANQYGRHNIFSYSGTLLFLLKLLY